MKNITKVKERTFTAILIVINLFIQPLSICFYIRGGFHFADILMQILAGLYLTISLSVLLNEIIFKIIFFDMLKGKIIRNKSWKLLLLVYSFMSATLLFLWLWSLMSKERESFFTMYILLLVPIEEIKRTYIIGNGYLFCGFTVIQLDTINWFKITRKGRSMQITIRYQGNKTFGTMNSSCCIEELAEYFETHQIKQRYYTNIA